MGPRLRAALATAGLALVAGSGVAAAAALGALTSGRLTGAAAAVGTCDANGLTVTEVLSGSNVVSVSVGDLADPACEGAQVRVRVVDAAGASIASGGPATIPTDAGTVPNSITVAITPNPAQTTVGGVRVLLTGP